MKTKTKPEDAVAKASADYLARNVWCERCLTRNVHEAAKTTTYAVALRDPPRDPCDARNFTAVCDGCAAPPATVTK